MTNAAETITVTSAWARATGRIVIPVDAARLPEVVAAAISGTKFTATDIAINGATLSTSVSAMSWGGKATLQFSAVAPGSSAIEARSEPLVPTNIFDFGQAKRDMRLLLETIAATAARVTS